MFKKLFRGKNKNSDSAVCPPSVRRRGWRTWARVLIIVLVFLLTIRLGWGWKAERDVSRAVEAARQAGVPVRMTDVPLPAAPPDDDAWPIYKELLDKASAAGVGMAAMLEYQAKSAPLTQAQQTGLQQDKQDEGLLKAWTIAQPMSAELIEKFRPRLAAHAELLVLLRQAAQKPAVRWRLTDDPSRPVDVDFRPLFRLLQLALAEAAIQYQSGETANALDSLGAVCRAAYHARQSPVLELQPMEVAVLQDALCLLQRWLPTLDMDSRQVSRLQAELRGGPIEPAIRTAMLFRQAWLQAVYAENLSAPDIGARLWVWFFRPLLDSSHAQATNVLSEAMPLLDKPYSQMAEPLEQLWARVGKAGGSAQWAQVNLQGLRIAAHGAALSEALRRMAAIALAARAYQLARGELPATLEALAPTFMDELPADPMTDKPFGYLPKAKWPRLYSVGLDRQDNGGKCDTAKDPVGQEGHDLCFFLAGVPDEPQPADAATTWPAATQPSVASFSASRPHSPKPAGTTAPAATSATRP